MKKILSLCLIALSSLAFSQVIANEDFNSLTLGNLVPDTTGSLGQSNYFANTGAVSDYQVVSVDAAHGNSLRFTSGAGNSDADDHLAFKNITVNADAGNNILKGSLEIFTGDNTGKGITECVVYDSNNFGIVGIGYDYESKKIVGKGRYTIQGPGGTSSTSFFIVELPQGPGGFTFPANTWVPVSFTYNKTTGAYEWKNPQGSFTYPDASVVPVAGLIPAKFSLGSKVFSDNASSNTSTIDNLMLMFTNTTLATNETSPAKAEISIYPNPASDFITVKSDSQIKNVEVYDVSGKKLNTYINTDKISVKSLLPGTYLMSIETKEGKISKKFIKK